MSKDLALKVAIIRLSSLGDIVSSIVFLDLLRAKFAQNGRKIDISFIVDSQFRGILENSPLVDKIIDLPLRQSKKDKRLIFGVIKKVRSLGHFDKVIDAQGLLKSALIGKMLKKSAFIGYDKDSIREKIASFFYTKKARIAYNEHILKRQYELFKVAFDEVAWESDFKLEMLDSRNRAMDSSPKAKAKIAQILAPHEANKKILFLCETSKADKEFSLDSFYALAEGLWSDYKDATIFLIWDKKEREIRAFGGKDSRFCVLPHLDFDEIKALLGSVDLVIGGDTGITHSAWAMRVPSVTIYISTNMKRFALCGEKHFSLSIGKNSSLGAPCGDFGNLGRFADAPVQSHAPNSQKTSQLPPQILELNSNADSAESSLRESALADSWQSKSNQSRDSATLKALSGAGVGVVREGEGSDFAIRKNHCIQAPTPSLKENTRGQKGEFNTDLSAESRKEIDANVPLDSRDLDSSLTAFAQNDESEMGCFGDESPRNDDNVVDCHENSLCSFSRNDGMGIDSHNAKSNANSTQIAQIAQIITFAKKVLQ